MAKKNPTHELVNVDLATGEEEFLGAGTYENCRATMENHIEQADEDIAVTGNLAYYPTMRIQPFQGW